jgi:mannose-6-phosphate isomerase-like protein (cupin superfamily)
MKQVATVAAAVFVAFGAGFGAAHLAAGSPLHAKGLVSQDGMTVGVQIGIVPKHYHADANEVQYVVDGTGTEWLGDKQVALKPGIMLIIPKGTPHGGSTETSGHLKIIALKTPPQAPDDTHLLP